MVLNIRTIESDKDRISDLPEDIIAQILSCLPTKYAVQTSILSRGWKYKWKSIYDIHIEGSSRKPIIFFQKIELEDEDPALIGFVDNVFNSTRDSKIRSFRLLCGNIPSCSQISTWISTALSRGIQKLEIEASSGKGVVLPKFLAEYCSLQELKITLWPCTLEIHAAMDCFSNLKPLYLDGGPLPFKILNTRSPNTGQLLLNFPVLRDLELQNCNFFDVKYVEIRAPELISFHSRCQLEKTEDYITKICAPKLAKFRTSFGYLTTFVLDAQSVYYVKLEHLITFETLASRARAILEGVPGLACLKLSPSVVQAFVREKELAFPTFDRLKRFEIHSFDAKTLMEILQWMPYLEYLNIIYCSGHCTYLFNLEEQHLVPLCIISHLKEVKFYDYHGISSEFDLIKFFTENATKLERVIVYLQSIPAMDCVEIQRLLLTLIPQSSACVKVFEQERPCSFDQEISLTNTFTSELGNSCKVGRAE